VAAGAPDGRGRRDEAADDRAQGDDREHGAPSHGPRSQLVDDDGS
jgi:hypothetical protein